MISIRRQLTRRLLGTTLGLLGLGLAALLALAGRAVVHQFDVALRTKALAVSTVAIVAADAVRVDFSDRFLQGFDDDDRPGPGNDDRRPSDFFQLRLPAGTVLARSESLGRAELPWRIGSFDAPRYFLCTLPNGHPGRAIGYAFQPKVAPGVTRKIELELVVATDREDLDETLLELTGLALGCAVLLLGTTYWVMPRVLRLGLQPLDRLGEQAARINAGSLAARFPVNDLPEELQPIAGRLNDLLARLEESFERERRFSGDLAHELRTPIAELRSLAECALKWPESRDPTTDAEVLAIARHMEALATRMLALARREPGERGGQTESVALPALVEEVWQVFGARAAARRLRVDFALGAATVTTDPVLLRSILSNLFDNAVEYAPDGGVISISLHATQSAVVLRVANLAANLETADVAKLFDPFWRKEAARTTGQHVGLGLALARTFAVALGWTLSAAIDQERRLVFSLGHHAAPCGPEIRAADG